MMKISKIACILATLVLTTTKAATAYQLEQLLVGFFKGIELKIGSEFHTCLTDVEHVFEDL